MKKKLVALILSMAMVASLTAGCGGFGSTTESSADTAKEEVTQAESGSDTEQITLTLWSIATESDAFASAYAQAIADYEAEHPNVKIVHETFENESYKTKIKSAIAANELPDIFFTWGGGFSQPFVNAGKILPLEDYYGNYEDLVSRATLANITYDDTIYGCGLACPINGIFYNKKIFDEQGLEIPKTGEELKEVCRKLIDAGITPFGISVKDSWVLAQLHDALTVKSAGPEKTAAAVTKQGQSYNDPDFVASAQFIKDLEEMGAFLDGAAGLSNDEASQQFYGGNVAMYSTGSWMAGSLQTDPENPEDFDYMPVPVLNSANAALTDFTGGPSDTLVASASTQYPDIAGEAVFELAKGISKYAYLSGAAIPSFKVDYDDSEVNSLTRKLVENANNATSFTLWFDTLMEAEDAGEYLALLQELYVGNLTPEEFARAMDEQLSK